MPLSYPSPAVGEKNLIDAVTQCVSRSMYAYFSDFPDALQATQYATVEAPPDGLALRAAPASDAPVVCVVPDGARLSVRARYADWCAVAHENRVGYVTTDGIVLHF